MPLRADPGALAAQLDEMVAERAGVLAANFLTDRLDHAAVAAAAARVRIVDFVWSSPDRALVDVAHGGGHS